MAQQQPRTLSEREFNALTKRVMESAPQGMSEADFNRWIGPAMDAAISQWERRPEPVNLHAGMRRFVTNAADVLNPVNLVEGTLQAVASPLQTTKDVWSAMGDQAGKARTAFDEGRYSEAFGHGVASAIPIIGPAAADAGEQMAEGDVAGGMGRAAALGAVSSPSVIRGSVNAARNTIPAGLRDRAAGALERGAADRVAGVMRPEVGPNKTRFGNTAADIAPKLVEEGMAGGWSREGLHHRVQDRFVAAQQKLDEAADARLSARSFSTEPLIAALERRLSRITAETVDATAAQRAPTMRISEILDESGKPIEVPGFKPEPYGKSVVPGPNSAEAAVIQNAIAELRALGPTARYDAIRTIRQAYDKQAKPKYNPSMTADYLKNQGGADGAANVTSVLREHLAGMDPRTAAANAEYSLFRSADDVLRATAEVERTRPKVGRRIMARLTGTIGGGQAAGAPGAIAGFVFAPVVEAATGAGFTVKLQTARLMTDLAKAIKLGNEAQVTSVLAKLRQMGARAAQVQGGAATSPSVSLQPTTAGAR